MTNFANKYATRLAAYLENDATTCTVESVTGDPAVPYNAIIGRKGAFPDEIVAVTNVTGTTLTITRATEAVAGVQTAYDHPVGATLTAVFTAGSVASLEASGVAISALPAVTTPVATDQFIVNQGGVSKRVTLPQILQTANVALSADVTLTTAGTWYEGPSAALTAGTWLVWTKAAFTGADAGPFTHHTQLYDGTAIVDESGIVAMYGSHIVVTGFAVVTLAAAATVLMQARSSVNGVVLARDVPTFSGHFGTRLVAVRIS